MVLDHLIWVQVLAPEQNMAGEKESPELEGSTAKKVWAAAHGNGGTEVKEENLWIVDPVAYIRIQLAKLLHPPKKVSEDDN